MSSRRELITAIVRASSFLIATALVGCVPPARGPSQAGPGSETSPADLPRTLTVAVTRAIRAFGPWDGSGSGGTYATHNLHSSPLITTDLGGAYAPRLLATLPSFENGTMVILPDGRLQTTWRLRPDVKWHDGAPFTAEDLVFTWNVLTDPEVGLQASVQVQQMEKVEATEPLTAMVTWKTSFFQSLYLGLREFWPFPKHVLAEQYTADKQAFANLPYWTSAFINTGPYRLADFVPGDHVRYERFNDYFLGRPKISTVVLRIFSDPNAAFANLISGELDILSENALPFELYTQLRDAWKGSGQGVVLERQANWHFLAPQFNPEWARPPELSRDVRVRRGLLYALDREALREAVLPGFRDLTDANSYMDRSDPRAPAVGQPFARYRYEPQRALRELAESGWNRASDGRMLNPAGQQVQIPIRTGPAEVKEAAIIAQHWRDLGTDVAEEVLPRSVQDRESVVKYAGFDAGTRGSGDFTLARFDSRLVATAQSRYVGVNQSSYANPIFDRMLDRLYSTIDQDQQGTLLREIGELLADDLPVFPLYFQVKMVAVTRGTRALVDDYAGSGGPGFLSRNAHLWDKD